jgi:hypothetical protein
MSLQTIITVTLCAVILVGCATILRRLYPETKGVERGVIVVVCCLLILAMLYLLCRTVA